MTAQELVTEVATYDFAIAGKNRHRDLHQLSGTQLLGTEEQRRESLNKERGSAEPLRRALPHQRCSSERQLLGWRLRRQELHPCIRRLPANTFSACQISCWQTLLIAVFPMPGPFTVRGRCPTAETFSGSTLDEPGQVRNCLDKLF